jgi:hypothetical protein
MTSIVIRENNAWHLIGTLDNGFKVERRAVADDDDGRRAVVRLRQFDAVIWSGGIREAQRAIALLAMAAGAEVQP